MDRILASQNKTALLGIGTACPAFAISQKEAAKTAGRLASPGLAPRIEEIFLATQIQQRGSVLLERNGNGSPKTSFYQPVTKGVKNPGIRERMKCFERESPGLALAAANEALTDAGVQASDITHLITITCTGFFAPGFDHALIESLNLPPEVQRIQIGFMGCHAAINGFRAARALALENPKHRILMAAVELSSLHYSYEDKLEHIIANALFSDGAAACVLGCKENSKKWNLAATASMMYPGTAGDMSWKVGDHGFEMGLSTRLPSRIQECLRGWLEPWLKTQGHDLPEIRAWAPHPGGPRVLDAVEKALGLAPEACGVSREILRSHGNMSSATLLFILKRLREKNAEMPCVALGFGPGLAAEAALFES
jgi:predicted naringenin-chalcone synthase